MTRVRARGAPVLLAVVLSCSGPALAGPAVGPPAPMPAVPDRPAGARPARPASRSALSWRTGQGKSYLIPALEIPAFEAMLNVYARIVYDRHTYDSTPATIWRHLTRGPWVLDQNSFRVNQFRHPYQGAVYHGTARSTGLGFWTAWGYAFAGSFLWEIAGETTDPSINDQVASGIAGSFLGEPLFRLASLLLEDAGGKPGFWREAGAAVLSPPLARDRLFFGDRFRDVFPGHDPAIFQRLRVGAATNQRVTDRGGDSHVSRDEALLSYRVIYGIPGAPGYTYDRPFDYFEFQLDVGTSRTNLENLGSRGLLLGREYGAGTDRAGVWGLYGSFDYLVPRLFRISSTALSLGTTSQWRLSRRLALQGTVLGGLGFGAARSLQDKQEAFYHYGGTAQSVAALRLICGRLAMLDVTERQFYISGLFSRHPRESDLVSRVDAGLTIRLHRCQALTAQYVLSSRVAHYSDRANRHQTVATWVLSYSLIGDSRFGLVAPEDREGGGAGPPLGGAAAVR